MNRRMFLITAAAATLAAAPMRADSIQDSIVHQLSAQGYGKVKISKTLLGRLRFVATSSEYRREIIVNARTGEILRDYTESLASGAATPRITSTDRNDDDRNDDREDDRDDDDDVDDADNDHDDDDDEDDKDDDDKDDGKDDDGDDGEDDD